MSFKSYRESKKAGFPKKTQYLHLVHSQRKQNSSDFRVCLKNHILSRVLTRDEIIELNKQGYKLDPVGNHMYIIGFLINDKQNEAADPLPFKIATKARGKIAATAIGRAWIPDTLPDGTHVRPKPNATSEEILQFQKDFAAGEIVAKVYNQNTENESVIIDVFPEYRQRVLDNDYPPLLSPLIGNYKIENGEVVDGEILHLQSVVSSGYDPAYAKFNGVCEADNLAQCMTELKTLAAFGKLKEWRDNSCPCPKKFLNTSPTLGAVNMPQDLPMKPTSTEAAKPANGENDKATKALQVAEQADAKVSKIESEVGEIKAMVEFEGQKIEELTDSNNELVEAVRAVAPTAQLKNVEKKAPTTQETQSIGAAGKQILRIKEELDVTKKDLKETKKKLETIEKQTEEEKKVAAQKLRLSQATTIVAGEIILKKFSPKDDKEKEARVKHYVELKKDGSEDLEDLKLLADNYADILGKPVTDSDKPESLGSFGQLVDDYTVSDGNEPDYDAIERSILNRQ